MKYFQAQNAVFISKEDIDYMYKNNIRDAEKISFRLWLASALVVVFVVLILWLSYRVLNPLIGVASVISPNGDVTRLNPRQNVTVTGEAAYKFAKEAAIELNTYFFIDYRNTLKTHKPLFTPKGYKAYLESTFNSGLFESVLNNLLNVTSSLSNKHFINATDYFSRGNHIWVVQVTLDLRTENKSGIDILSTKNIVLIMKEVDRNISKTGLLIMEISETT